MARTIPLRFVETLSAPNSGPLNSLDHIHQAVARTNKIWSSVSVEYWIRSIKSYHMPNLHRYIRDKDASGCPDGSHCFTWTAVRDELRQVFPIMPENAYPANDKKSAGYWLLAASALYGDPNEILVWLLDESGTSGAAAPWTGRMVYVRNGLWDESLGIASAHLAHELGHFFGLTHNDSDVLPPGYDHCDHWDRVFLPGTPNISSFRERCSLQVWLGQVHRS